MTVAYLPAFGSGLGHVSRLSLVARELQNEGLKVRFSCFGEGAKYLQQHGFECDICPAIDVGWSDGKLSTQKTIMGLPGMMLSFMNQVQFEWKNMARLKPAVVFDDSRLSAVIAASSLGIPCVTMLNQVRLRLPENRWGLISRITEEVGAELLGRTWSKSKELLIPDIPPPSTICAENVWGISSIDKKLHYTGFVVPRKEFDDDAISKIRNKLGLDGSRKTFFAQISGPAATREGALKKILEASKKENGEFTFIVSGGNPVGSTEPVRIGSSWYFEWCPIRDELFALADYSIIRGGHSTIAQSILYGKPMIVIPIENHSEQIGNANKVSELGLGICLRPEDLEPDRLLGVAEEISSDGKFVQNAQEVASIAKKYNGPENAAKAVISNIGN